VGDASVRGRISQEEAAVAEEAVLRRMDRLPRQEGDILSRVLELKAQGREVVEREYAKASADTRRFEGMIHRAPRARAGRRQRFTPGHGASGSR